MPTETITTRTLDAPGARITYDVRGVPDERTLLMIGSPMDASGFGTLASHFTDRPVATYDPRGGERSPRTDGAPENTVAEHAEDLHRVIESLGAGPVDVFASSGGAVNALALVAAHPGDVRTLVAHEPPASATLPDRETALGATDLIWREYQAGGTGPAMARFIALVSHQGPVTQEWLDAPAPDPAMFGLPVEDDGTRTDPLMANLRGCTAFVPDVAALSAAPTRIMIAAGVESGEELAARGARAVAERLGLTVTAFPSGHAGFLGGEFGQHGDPDAFAPALRAALDG